MAGDKKRKGKSRAIKNMLYKSEGRVHQNCARKAKAQRTLFLKLIRKALGFTREQTDKLLSQFTVCSACKGQRSRNNEQKLGITVATFAPVIKVDEQTYGNYCVRCGHR